MSTTQDKPLVATASRASGRDRIIRMQNLWKTYYMGDNEVHALAGISNDFHRGDFWAIMGSSGSGKSTMLNLLGCLDRPSEGIYELEGEDVSHLDDDALSDVRLKRIGFIFQSFNLIAQMTVQENIELPLYYQGWEREASRARAAELADRVGLAQRLDHRPTQLSGGQQQRVAVARALANDPAILLADEPTGNLDTATGVQIMDLLGELHRSGVTIIMVTHEDEIAAHASHQMHMRDGKIERVLS